jgi:hypothetical protein
MFSVSPHDKTIINITSVAAILSSFTTVSLPKIGSLSACRTFASIIVARTQLNANAVNSNGSGDNHGHPAINISPEKYLELIAVPFEVPSNPPTYRRAKVEADKTLSAFWTHFHADDLYRRLPATTESQRVTANLQHSSSSTASSQPFSCAAALKVHEASEFS